MAGKLKGLNYHAPGRWRGKIQLPKSRKSVSKMFYGEKISDVKRDFMEWKAKIIIDYEAYMVEEKTIRDIVPIWIDSLDIRIRRGNIRKSTRDSYYFALQNAVDRMGDIEPKKLNLNILQDFVDYLALDLKLSPSYVRYHIKILNMMMDYAVTNGDAISNITRELQKSLEFPKQQEKKPKVIDDDKVAELISKSGEESFILARAIEFACETGLRRAELLGLRYTDINNEGIIELESQLANDGSKNIELKTEYSARGIPLTSRGKEILAEVRQHQLEQKIKLGKAYVKTGYIFTDEVGKPYLPDYLTKFFKKMAIRVKLPDHTFHATRHTYASNLIRAGIDVSVVSKLLGHYTPSFTYKVYIHLFTGAKMEAIEKFDQFRGNNKALSPTKV